MQIGANPLFRLEGPKICWNIPSAMSKQQDSVGWPGIFELPEGWIQHSYDPKSDIVTFIHKVSRLKFAIEDWLIVTNPREIENRLRDLAAPAQN